MEKLWEIKIHRDKKLATACGIKTCGIKHKDCECFLRYGNIKDYLKEYKCLWCNNNYTKKKFDENFTRWFVNTYKFSKNDIKRYIEIKSLQQLEQVEFIEYHNQNYLTTFFSEYLLALEMKKHKYSWTNSTINHKTVK